MLIGAMLGPYRIVEKLGQGGMGEVYRARDTKLQRDVALKVLPEAFVLDADRRERFEREAYVLATLNHPQIAQIYGIEESSGARALVMELVDGPSLADRLSVGAMSLEEALPIAAQIASALEAAHEQGIIHRDLKPANIALTTGGTVKVLDFGLAKTTEPVASALLAKHSSAVEDFPTSLSSPVGTTVPGLILGTAPYMAPEQATGKAIDKRVDIWAFGCVLFEMLTGTRAFPGTDVADTLATILKTEPVWSALPSATPPSIRALLRRCLEKDPRRRLRDIGDARLELLQPYVGTAAAVAPLRPRAAMPALAFIAGCIATALVVWLAFGSTESSPVSRLQISPLPAAALTIDGSVRDLALTPDGSRLVYVGANGNALFVRALDQLEPLSLTDVGAVRGPFVSPDGQWIGFFEANTVLKKIAITGGPSIRLSFVDGLASRGAAWGSDGKIIFATNNMSSGLQQISAMGGEATILTRPNRARDELDHVWPELLPGGNAVLFTILRKGGLDRADVAVLDLQTGTQTIVVTGGSDAHYLPTGHLIYAASGTLRAVGFDLRRLSITGTAAPVLTRVLTTPYGAANVAVAANGTLVYVAGGVAADQRRLVWVDRRGQETPVAAPPRAYVYPRISPDGTRIAVYLLDPEQDIWMWDFSRSTLTRVTFDSGFDTYPVWAPDGRRLLFASERIGTSNLFAQVADGTGAVEQLTDAANVQLPTSVSPDGTRLVFTETSPSTGADIKQLSLNGTRAAVPLVQMPFTERNAEVSPDGRWLAYEANDSGQFEIYVRPFPAVNDGHWQVSTGGGTRPLWARDGRELFYLAPNGAMMRVGIGRESVWSATAPMQLFGTPYLAPVGNPGRTYDLSANGERFLMIKSASADPTSQLPSFIVVQNWHEELKQRVPVR